MPRVQVYVQDIDEAEELEEQENWEEIVGLRSPNERREAQFGSSEARDRRRNVRGGHEALARRRSERRKSVHRGGRRD